MKELYLTEYSCKTCEKYKKCSLKKRWSRRRVGICPDYRFTRSLAAEMKKDILNAHGSIVVYGKESPARHDFARKLAGFYPKERLLVSYVSIGELLAGHKTTPRTKEKRQMVWAFVYLNIINVVMADILWQCENGEISRARLNALALSYGIKDVQNYDDLLGLVQAALMSWDEEDASLEIPDTLRSTSFILDKIRKNILDNGRIILIVDDDALFWQLNRLVINELLLRDTPEIKVFCDPYYSLNTKRCLLANRCINTKDYDIIDIDDSRTS